MVTACQRGEKNPGLKFKEVLKLAAKGKKKLVATPSTIRNLPGSRVATRAPRVRAPPKAPKSGQLQQGQAGAKSRETAETRMINKSRKNRNRKIA